jgi:hypothetical protein
VSDSAKAVFQWIEEDVGPDVVALSSMIKVPLQACFRNGFEFSEFSLLIFSQRKQWLRFAFLAGVYTHCVRADTGFIYITVS